MNYFFYQNSKRLHYLIDFTVKLLEKPKCFVRFLLKKQNVDGQTDCSLHPPTLYVGWMKKKYGLHVPAAYLAK